MLPRFLYIAVPWAIKSEKIGFDLFTPNTQHFHPKGIFVISYEHFLEDYFKTTIRTKDLDKDFFQGLSSYNVEYNLVDKRVQVFYLFVYFYL